MVHIGSVDALFIDTLPILTTTLAVPKQIDYVPCRLSHASSDAREHANVQETAILPLGLNRGSSRTKDMHEQLLHKRNQATMLNGQGPAHELT